MARERERELKKGTQKLYLTMETKERVLESFYSLPCCMVVNAGQFSFPNETEIESY